MKRKAQLQMGESIFVVIIILLLIIFGLVFASNAEEDEIIKKNQAFQDLDAITTSKYAASLTELQCSVLDVIEMSCYDINKMSAFMKVTEIHPDLSAEYYFSQLGNANITIKEIYPSDRSWEVYYNGLGYDRLGNEIVGKSKSTILPITLFDSITKKKSFGILIIESISK